MSDELAERLKARGDECKAAANATHDGPRDTERGRARAFYEAAQMARESKRADEQMECVEQMFSATDPDDLL